MILTVENLGPIKKGNIDLGKPLTILTGPNNNGKSYLTYLIHGIGRIDKLGKYISYFNKIGDLFKLDDLLKNKLLNSEAVDFDEIILGNDNIKYFSDIYTEAVTGVLSKIFASTQVTPSIHIDIKIDTGDNPSDAFETFHIEGNKLYGTTYGGFINKDFFQSKIFDRYEHDAYEKAIHVLSLITSSYIQENIGYSTANESYFFPAERTAINLFAKHITSTKAGISDDLDDNIIAGLSDEELVKRLRNRVDTGPKYPYAIRDYINFVNDFKIGERESSFATIAAYLEESLIGGEIHLDNFNRVLFTPQGLTSSLEIHLSSSLVKSLSYLILYLRYNAKAGDQIIIDEPELNLHPDLQISIAKTIAQMANAGLKVIISTHSDYLIKEINNLILLGELNTQEKHQSFVHEKGFNENELLTKVQVGAYFLHDGTIDLIDLEENGLVVPTIDNAIRRVDGLAEEIFMEMEG